MLRILVVRAGLLKAEEEEEEEISKFSLDKVLGTKFHPALEVS